MKPSHNPRRGIVLIALMIFLAVATMLVLSWLKIAGLERRQLRSLQERAQAEWLAESALERAAARLSADPEYTGETWKLTPDELSGRDEAEVLIRVEPVADESQNREIVVRADYPVAADRRHRRTKTLTIDVTPQ